jgi:hypothetical protein
VTGRGEQLRERPGTLGRWCRAVDRTAAELRRAEREAATLERRVAARGVRIFYEALVLGLIGLVEIDTLRHRAANALATPTRRR